MEFLTGFIQNSQQSVVERAKQLSEEKKITENVFTEANDCAQKIATNIIDPAHNEELAEFPRLNGSEFEYYLVLDFLESIGCKFAPTVFKQETRMQGGNCPHKYLADNLYLRQYDKTPILVQLIQELRKHQEK